MRGKGGTSSRRKKDRGREEMRIIRGANKGKERVRAGDVGILKVGEARKVRRGKIRK